MKNIPTSLRTSSLLFTWVPALAFQLCAPSLHADTLTWDADSGTAGIQEGSGTWNTTNDNWDNSGSNVAWNNGTPDSAIFAGSGSGGTVTIDQTGGITTSGLTFSGNAYTLQGTGVDGTLTFADGASVVNNTSSGITSLRGPLATVAGGTVSFSGTRLWLYNSSFSGGGTLNVDTSAKTLVENVGAFDGLETINLSGASSFDVRVGGDLGTGVTLNIKASGRGLDGNSSSDINWVGAVVLHDGSNSVFGNASGSVIKISGDISETGGSAGLSSGGSSTVILTGSNSYTGLTNIGSNRVVQVGEGGTEGSLSGAGSIFLNGSNATINFNRSDAIAQGSDFGDSISGTGRLNQMGSGTLVLNSSNNSYSGNTYVSDGTLLVNNTTGSGTGTGSVQVGYDAITDKAGTATSGSRAISVADTTGLLVGQEISGVGIAEGAVITNISGNTVYMSIDATDDVTAFNRAAATGILGGTGTIKPTAGNSISVASGSSVAPGASIGTFTLDGGSTSEALLTMDAGASFTFELDANSANADQLRFFNYVSGDLVLNDNALNVSLSGEPTLAGEYTVSLFQFYSDEGSSIASSTLIDDLEALDGLVLVLGEGVETGILNYNNANGSIDLTYTVVPEPSMFALVGMVLVSTVLIRRRR
ncbi:autotransporter-associated beta strand repeat-containing protein [Coraliomargarita algicola]|uniref:Autotransporter-associated beta strand repeat-containing protein n=1 Tax=Coraliomargarita algicola TaxID=3092156 RepID=A0ABZ0RJB7_9BACT|nr:autotransporter-associated beta strand repeat-containing protein [Coraliomargarita sp. J2-16]WPJ95568.1 autotransporter-associated beta strand repeat-containing protein [Coraliomargarita sp. J2-16]